MGKDDLIEAARLGNYPTCEKILSSKPKKPGPFARYSEFLINSIIRNNIVCVLCNNKQYNQRYIS